MILKREFYFVRHGQTDANLVPSMRAALGDVPLNATGVAEAERIVPLIASLPVRTICHSPLKRARQTKEICSAQLSHPQHEIADLGECAPGIWDKMTALGADARFATEEPVYSFMQRVRSGVNQALSKEGPVLIVAHGGVHWALSCWMQVDNDWVIGNCVVVHFSLSPTGSWQARKLLKEQHALHC